MPRASQSDSTREPAPVLVRPICSECARPMRLTRVMPHETREHVELRTFECKCGHELVQIADL